MGTWGIVLACVCTGALSSAAPAGAIGAAPSVATSGGAPKVVEFSAPRRFWCVPEHPRQAQVTAEGEVPIAGRPVRAVTYESSYPGPTLELAAGDELAVDLVNDGDQPTNLHTHGLHVSPTRPADDVLLDIKPGDSFQYRYAVPADHPGGTFWYATELIGESRVPGGGSSTGPHSSITRSRDALGWRHGSPLAAAPRVGHAALRASR